MLFGFMEGLVGVQDQGCMMDAVNLCPRWAATGITSAEVSVGYEASGAQLGYTYEEHAEGIRLELETRKTAALIHLLLPEGAQVASVSSDSGPVDFSTSVVGKSQYVNCQFPVIGGIGIDISFK
jgi:hypothetical protein